MMSKELSLLLSPAIYPDDIISLAAERTVNDVDDDEGGGDSEEKREKIRL